MSDPFAAQLSAFRKTLQPTDTSKAAKIQDKTPETEVEKKPVVNNSTNELKKPSDEDIEQPAKRLQLERPTNSSNRPTNSSNLTMRLMTSSDYIKSHNGPVSVNELEKALKITVDAPLLKCLSNVDRIQYQDGKFQYLSLHNIKTGADLVRVLENQPAFAGISVKQLKDGWSKCIETIDELEKDHYIIVHRTKKDNSARHVWLNKDRLEMGCPASVKKLWDSVSIPAHDDLVKLLVDNGLTPTNAEPESMRRKKITSVKERKQKKTRRGKITNIHMKGILKDYSGKLK